MPKRCGRAPSSPAERAADPVDIGLLSGGEDAYFLRRGFQPLQIVRADRCGGAGRTGDDQRFKLGNRVGRAHPRGLEPRQLLLRGDPAFRSRSAGATGAGLCPRQRRREVGLSGAGCSEQGVDTGAKLRIVRRRRRGNGRRSEAAFGDEAGRHRAAGKLIFHRSRRQRRAFVRAGRAAGQQEREQEGEGRKPFAHGAS